MPRVAARIDSAYFNHQIAPEPQPEATMQLSDDYLQTFSERGFVLVENFYPEEKRAAIAAALRRTLPPWQEIKDDPPESPLLIDDFPYADQFFNKLIIDWDLIDFVQRILATEHIHFRYAHNWARYPDPNSEQPGLHRDNGNNSLLPVNADHRYGQISTWYFPEAVPADQAPMRIIPRAHDQDLDKRELLTVPAGAIMIFNTHIWHSATLFTGSEGQRYSVTRIYGRADHYWEGVRSYTNLGMDEDFRVFIGTLSARDRELFRFPPAGHEYYTSETLGFLEEQYPGWNAKGEYTP